MKHRRKNADLWVDTILQGYEVEDLPLPLEDYYDEERDIARHFELGRGSFGSVLKTDNPDIVIKITKDSGEAAVAKFCVENAENDELMNGIVQYYAVRSMGHMDGAEIYALWREKVDHVGVTYWDTPRVHSALNNLGRLTNSYVKQELAQVSWLDGSSSWNATDDTELACRDYEAEYNILSNLVLRDFDAGYLFATYADFISEVDGIPWISRVLAAYNVICDYISYSRMTEAIGNTLIQLFNAGFILLDTYSNNLGTVRREGRETCVIFDPGYVVILP